MQNYTNSFQQLSQIYSNAFNIAQKFSKNMMSQYMQKKHSTTTAIDPLNIGRSMASATTEVWSNPNHILTLYISVTKTFIDTLSNLYDHSTAIKDKRFHSSYWKEQHFYMLISSLYLNYCSAIMNLVKNLDSLNSLEKKKVEFYTKLFLDSAAPSNFFLTNPDAINEAISTNGQSIIDGIQNFLYDMSKENFSITTANANAFAVGKNLAVTNGHVVFQNGLIELIQYTPTTKSAFSIPLLILPAWINKYYILDLSQKNSFVKWLVDQGHTVFMISWANPTKEYADKDFVHYMQEGPIAAIERIKELMSCNKVNAIGYCLGGTLLSATIAYLKSIYTSNYPINTATFLTTLIDFTEAGDIGVFIDEEQISAIEKKMSKNGFISGFDMAQVFSMLKANDMIWNFYINNYLMGKAPMSFDILTWNADSTRLPSKMHSFYLRNMYHKNLLCKKGGINIDGVPIDIALNDLPTYILATQQDHIVPWQSAYKAMDIYSSTIKKFVLSGSGHVAGVVNPPQSGKYGYWSNDSYCSNPEDWLKNAIQHTGSWWEDWQNWIKPFAGDLIPASLPKEENIISEAPGSYVYQK